MADSTIKKIQLKQSPRGEMGQSYLASGKQMSLRFWDLEPQGAKAPTSRDYETLGFVINGRAELMLEGQNVDLGPGDSWLVPPHADHSYRIIERFTAIEATSPPAHVKSRDASAGATK